MDLTFYEKQHIQRLLQQEGSVKFIYDDFIRSVSSHMSKWVDSGNGQVWSRNASIEKAIEKELVKLHGNLLSNIDQFTKDGWNRSDIKTDDLITQFVGEISISKTLKDGLFARNTEALRAFQTRKIDNLTISDRVWNTVGTAKQNIEYYLQSGISTGRASVLISQDMRQLLANPDRLFHRIRNANGKLVPSAPMAAYHPGQGIYRSSFMNAKRLAVSETNGAYRSADFERWSKMDIVLGVQVSRSASARGACDVCDPLAGKYPKDFKFWSWHPFCICVATPILMSEDEFMNYLADGSLPKGSAITDLPDEARVYMQDKLDGGKVNMNSYLFVDNQKFFP